MLGWLGRRNVTTLDPAALRREPPSAFVSYAREDAAFVHRVAEALAIQGVVVHGDWELTGGERYQDQLDELILNADTVVFVLAPESVASEACARELQLAVGQGKRVVPLVRRNVPEETTLPTALREPQWLFLREPDDFVHGIQALGRALQTDPELLPEHRRLSVAADGWEKNGRNPAYLLRGYGLEQAERWLARASAAAPRLPQPTPLQAAFILASQRARRRRTRRFLGIAGFVSLAFATLGIWADGQRRTAEQRRKVARARELVAEANLMRARQPTLLPRSALLTLEALGQFPSMEATQALYEVLHLLPRPLTELKVERHVRDVAFSPDGRFVATAAADDTARLWEVDGGREVARLPHDAPVMFVAFSPDGTRLITASDDHRGYVWDVGTREVTQRFSHQGRLAVSPDGKYFLLTTREDAVVTTPEGERVSSLPAPGYAVRVALSPDDRLMAVADADGIIQVAAIDGGRLLKRFASEDETAEEATTESDLKSLTFSPDGRYLAAGSQAGTVRVWDAQEWREVARIDDGTAALALAFRPDGARLAIAGQDGTVRLWTIPDREEVGRLLHGDVVSAVVFSRDGSRLATASADGTARIWTLADSQDSAFLTSESSIGPIAFSPDGHDLSAGSADGTTMARSVDGTPVEPRTMTQQESEVWDLAFSADGRYVATASNEDGTARVWQREDGKEVRRVAHEGAVLAVGFSPDSTRLATGGKDGTVRLWTLPDGQEVVRFTHDEAVQDLVFSPDGTRVASGSDDGTARVWDLAGRREAAHLTHDTIVFGVAFSPDGTRLATAAADHVVRLWRVATGSIVRRMTHEDLVYRVAFTPDGRYLATASADGTARVWETESGREVVRIPHESIVTRVAVSPDGRLLATVSGDHLVRLWHWRPEDLAAEVCARLTHNLTQQEWEQYLPDDKPYRKTCPNLP